MAQTGSIKFIHKDGFGFIVPDSGEADVFMHKQDIVGPVQSLSNGEKVTYTISDQVKAGGKLQALLVTSLDNPPPPDGSFPAYDPYAAAAATAGYPAYPAQGVYAAGAAAAAAAAAGGNPTGSVKWYSEEKGFGFIVTAAGTDIYFKGGDVQGAPLTTGETVMYSVIAMGVKQQAIDVARVADTPQQPQAAAWTPEQQAYMAAYGQAAGYPMYGFTDPATAGQYAYAGADPGAAYAQQPSTYDPYAAFAPPAQAYPGFGGAADGSLTGACKWFNPSKGFGFLVGPDGADLYFKGQDVSGPDLESGEVVKYEIITMSSGKKQATNLNRVAAPAGGVKRKADGEDGYTGDSKRGAV